MTKSVKHLLLVCCGIALLLCGALFAACGEENETPPPGGEVSVSGHIVFESDDSDEYTREITLSFLPNGSDVQGVPAELSYTNEEDETVTADGFTLARGESGYTLADKSGKQYALDLAWGCANPKDDFAVVHGDFIVTDTIEDYEAHEAGARHYIQEGYFGAGSLDVSGKVWYYNLEEMRHVESSYLRFYLEHNEDLDYTWKGTSARGNIWVNHECDDGNDYLVYYFIVEHGGARKALFYDVRFFPADAETIDFHHYFGDFYFKNGTCIYASNLIAGSEVGDGALTLFEKDAFEGVNGKLYARVYPRLALTYGTDGATDWMLYRFTGSEAEGSTEEFYFELDADGNIKPETAQMGCRVWRQDAEKTWGYDAFYIAPSPEEIVFTMLFGLGRVNGGKTEYFADPLIVKRADAQFTVYAEDGAWNVSLGLDEEAWKITFDIEAAAEVAIEGKIAFDEDSERADHDFDEDITLRFTPVEGSADGAPATLIYSDGAGNTAVKGGFTLAASGDGYVLRDGAGHEYAVDLTWTPQDADNSVTLHGEFIADEEIKDYEGAMNTAYHGYFGLAGVQVSHEMWWIQFGEIPRKQTKCLNVYNEHIFDKPRYHDPVYGDLYAGYNYIPGDGGYAFELYLTEKNGTRCLLVRQIDYLPETLTWTTNACEVDNGYAEGGGSVAITKSTILYSAKLFGLNKGMEIYTPYSDDTEHTPVRQLGYIFGTGIDGERDWMFLKDEEEGFLIHVEFDENGNITKTYDAYAGFVFDYMPDLSTDLQYAVGAFFLSNAEDIYTPIKIYAFGYFTGGALYYPPYIKVETNENDTFTVNEVTAGGEEVIRQWTVSFTDLGAEVPVPHVAEVGEVLDYSLSFNWVYAETGASEKNADVFFVAPSAVTGKEGQEILNFSYTSARRNFKGAIDMEKGIYDDNARFFAPYYRQAVLYDYKLDGTQLENYLNYAYQDVRNAFLYYMEHWNGGRPVILAGFSQGADHCIRLMKEFFGSADSAGWKDRLVACYAIGWRITEQELTENGLTFAAGESDIGVIVSFNTEAESVTDSLTVPAGTTALCINPLNWKTDGTVADKNANMGACFFDISGNLTEEKAHLTGAYIDTTRGTLKVPDEDIDPAVYNNTLGGYVGAGVYHYYDYQFFYKNLEANVQARITAYTAAHA